jgi:DNA-binding beta-propeller fold protein YncE
MLAVTADGRTTYTGNIRDGTVSQLDVPSGARTRLFTTPPQPEAIAVSPDGREVWVGSNSEGKVSILDTRTGEVDEALEGFTFPYRILITPDLRHVLIPDFRRHELRIVDRAAREAVEVLTFDGAGPQGITMSPDGTTIYHSFSLQDRVAIIDFATREIVRFLPTGDGPDGVAYTPRIVEQP